MESKQNTIPSEIDWARLAAYIDGEGYICIRKRVRKEGRWNWQAFDICIRLSNTDPRLPLWCKQTFGGFLNDMYGIEYRHCKKALYAWDVHGTNCRAILEGVLPYSIIKQEQIKIGLAYLDTLKLGKERYRKHRYVPEEVKLRRAQLYEEMKDARNIKELPVN